MATVMRETNTPSWRRAFSDAQWQQMVSDDAAAFKTVSIVLASVILLGFAAIVTTVMLVL